MERPEDIHPDLWAKMVKEATEFAAYHKAMHSKMQEILGVSQEDYYRMCAEIAEEESD